MAKIRGIKPDFWTDEDIVELTPLARLLYIGLWNYACDNGHLEDRPKQIKMRVLPADECSVADLLRELDEKGRITRNQGWIIVPNLTDHQRIDKRFFTTCDRPGCARPGAESANPERKTRRAHDESTSSAHRDHVVPTPRSPGDCDGEGDGECEGDGDSTRELTLAEAPRADVERLCEHLANRVEANGATRPTVSGRWLTAARLMLDADGRTEADVHAAIDWCQSDEFWRANVLSMPKLREKYDQLRLQAQRGNGRPTKQAQTDDLFARSAQRLGVTQ